MMLDGSQSPPTVGGFIAPGWAQQPDGSWHVIPNVGGWKGPDFGQVDRGTLDQTSTPAADRQMTIAALDALIIALYGQPLVGAILVNAWARATDWLFFIFWGEGPIDSGVALTLDDKLLPAGISETRYLGTTGQVVNSQLAAAYATQGLTWNLALDGIVYSVITVPYALISGAPRFNLELKGRKLYDPRLDSSVNWNLYLQSSDLTAAAWAVSAATIAATAINSPFGEYQKGFRLAETATTAQHLHQQAVTLAGATVYTMSAYLKFDDRAWASLFFATPDGVGHQGWFNLVTGAVGTTTNCSAVIAIVPGTLWYRCSITNTSPGAHAPASCNTAVYVTSADNVTSYLGAGGGIFMWGRQIEPGPVATTYSPTTTFPQTYANPATWTWSDNPSLIGADFEVNAVFGRGNTMDWASVIPCANENDFIVGSGISQEKKRRCTIAVDREASLNSWSDTFRAAGAYFRIENQGTVKFIADAPGPSVATYSHAAGTILRISNEVLSKTRDLPTVIELTYTDKSVLPWKDGTVIFNRTGVVAGTTPFRRSQVRMQWVGSSSQARREATERCNKLWLRGLTFDMEAFDEAVKQESGDLVTVIYPDSGYNLQVRTINNGDTPQGWLLKCEKEDPGAYNYDVQVDTPSPITNWPAANAPPAMGAITLVEETYPTQDSASWYSRIAVTWAGLVWPFLESFKIEITQAGNLKDSTKCNADCVAWVSKPLTEGLQYDVMVSVVSSSPGSVGAAAVASITLIGRVGTVPANVASLTGFEINGEVRLTWSSVPGTAATELRYGAVGGSWAAATLLNRVATPAVRYQTKDIASGPWRFWAKGLDNVRTVTYPWGQESATPAFVDIAVSLDNNAFVAASHAFNTPTLVNMVAVTDYAGNTTWVSDQGATWSSNFPSNLDTYTSVLAAYYGLGSSSLETESFDVGSSVTGDWLGAIAYTDLVGGSSVIVNSLRLSPDNSVWTDYVSGSAKATARYVRLKISVTNGAILVTSLGSFTVNILSKGESSQSPVTTSASAYTVVPLAASYNKALSVAGSLIGTTAGYTRYDNVQVSGGRAIHPRNLLLRKPSTTFGFAYAPDIAATRVQNSWTVEVLLKPDGSNTKAVNCLLSKWSLTASPDGFLFYVPAAATTLAMQIYRNGSPTVNASAANALRADALQRVSFTWSGTVFAALVDGAIVYTVTLGAGNGPLNAMNGPLMIGDFDGTFSTSAADADAASYFLGGISDIRLWNTVRTQAQIIANMNAVLTGSESGLVAYYKCNDAIGNTTLVDSTSNANSATISGANTDVRLFPSDGFDFYGFNAAGTQVAAPATWSFRGV